MIEILELIREANGKITFTPIDGVFVKLELEIKGKIGNKKKTWVIMAKSFENEHASMLIRQMVKDLKRGA